MTHLLSLKPANVNNYLKQVGHTWMATCLTCFILSPWSLFLQDHKPEVSKYINIKDKDKLIVVIIKREIGVRICSMGGWGKGVPQWAHVKASLPPEGPYTQ